MADDALLIVGLGNPGSEYASTRHNAGFMALDGFCASIGATMTQTKYKGIFATARFGGQSLLLLKPQTYMNLSGESVVAAMGFYHLDIAQVLVIHDDLDLPVGDVRVKTGGGAGGHNGLKSIISLTGKDAFHRVRIGIGRPEHGDVVNYVLGSFPEAQAEPFRDSLNIAVEAVRAFVASGPQAAMRYCNGLFRAKKKKEEATRE